MDAGMVKILLVDDNPDLLGLWSAALKRAGYRTSTASNGEKALEKLKRDQFQVCVLDLKMPRINGMEILKWIQKTGLRIRVIVATGYGSVESAVQAMRKGAWDYLQKPFPPDHLVGKVDDAVEEMEDALEGISARIWRAVRLIHDRYPQRLSVEEMADVASCSVSCFSRAFRKTMGCSPVAYVNRMRVEEAKRMLKKGESLVKEVAFSVGFQDLRHFGRTFKRLVGMTPTEYREQSRKEATVEDAIAGDESVEDVEADDAQG